MSQPLTLHPDCRCDAVEGIAIELGLAHGAMVLQYLVTGTIADVVVPPLSAPERTDGLWRRTCFEAFARRAGEDAYFEFNFSPSTEWAAYAFDAYRQGMAPALDAGEPDIQVRSGPARLDLTARMSLQRFQGLAPGAAAEFGFCAVIEETNGRLSYWALAHPRGKPDFHHGDGFACILKREA